MQATPYLLPLLITTILSVLVVLVIWRRRDAPGAMALALLMVGVAVWALTYLLGLSSRTLEAQLFWANLSFLGIVLVPASWLTFALSYSHYGAWITPRRLILLTLMPVLTLLAVWTNPQHQLFRHEVWLIQTGSFVVLATRLGPLFWLHTLYSYLLLLLGTILLVRNLFRMSPAYRRQSRGLLIGIVTPWLGNALYLSGLNPFPHLDLTPFALGISGFALAWDLMRFGLFDLVPIAYGRVFQSMEDGVIVLDGQSRIVDLNPAVLALMHRSAREVIGQPAAKVLPAQSEIVERYRQVNEAHEELMLEVTGEQRWFDMRISPISDRHGRLNGRVVVLHDSTERRRAASVLQQQNDELTALARENARLYATIQQELAERTQAEVSLSLAKEAAEVANRAKSRFLGNMSHELRTPLAAILGYADLMQSEAHQQGYDQMSKDIERIQIAGRHLLELISDVLDITRIEAEQLELRPEHFDLATLVTEVADTVRPLVQKNRNTLLVECDAASGMMYSDSTRVRQVLLNVLGNAAKFTEQGHITLRVTVGNAVLENRRGLLDYEEVPVVSFQISDTGIGMHPEQQQQLFKEFMQADDTPTRKYGGSGMGLAISYRLCHLMGGTIYATSEFGKGSTFTIDLPMHLVVYQANPGH